MKKKELRVPHICLGRPFAPLSNLIEIGNSRRKSKEQETSTSMWRVKSSHGLRNARGQLNGFVKDRELERSKPLAEDVA